MFQFPYFYVYLQLPFLCHNNFYIAMSFYKYLHPKVHYLSGKQKLLSYEFVYLSQRKNHSNPQQFYLFTGNGNQNGHVAGSNDFISNDTGS